MQKNAAYIYTIKNGPTCEFRFNAKDEDDLFDKATVLFQIAGSTTGSIFGWINDPVLDPFREKVTIIEDFVRI